MKPSLGRSPPHWSTQRMEEGGGYERVKERGSELVMDYFGGQKEGFSSNLLSISASAGDRLFCFVIIEIHLCPSLDSKQSLFFCRGNCVAKLLPFLCSLAEVMFVR